jgi:hypothetical protein
MERRRHNSERRDGQSGISEEGVSTAAAPNEVEGDARVALLEAELANRDEIIVALQHLVRDLRPELENLRAEHLYGAFAQAG